MTLIELDAAERVIESDSFLMQAYLGTSPNLRFQSRIREVFKSHIRHDQKALAEFNRIKSELEANQTTED